MKYLLLTLSAFCQFAYGQRRLPSYDGIDEAFKKGDSLELLYANDSLLKISTDTLPLNESETWRDMKLVTYFYDNSKDVKKISFRNGKEGYYYFYFEKTYLRKLRIIKAGGLINLQYYFREKDNGLADLFILEKTDNYLERKEFYDFLLQGRDFYNIFKLRK